MHVKSISIIHKLIHALLVWAFQIQSDRDRKWRGEIRVSNPAKLKRRCLNMGRTRTKNDGRGLYIRSDKASTRKRSSIIGPGAMRKARRVHVSVPQSSYLLCLCSCFVLYNSLYLYCNSSFILVYLRGKFTMRWKTRNCVPSIWMNMFVLRSLLFASIISRRFVSRALDKRLMQLSVWILDFRLILVVFVIYLTIYTYSIRNSAKSSCLR